MLLVAAAIATVAFAVPAVASASNWTENGKELAKGMQWSQGKAALSGEATLSISGALNYSLGANCSTAGGLIVLGSNGEGYSGLEVTPSSCAPVNAMKSLGCKSVSSVTSNTFPAVKAVEVGGVRKITLENVSLTYQFTGTGLCAGGLTLTASGTITATPDNSGAISSLTLSGELDSTTGTKATIGGTQAVSPAGKYGIIAKGSGNTLAGNLEITGAASCPVSGMIDLNPSSNTGQISSMSWDAGKCIVSGAYKAAGCNAVSSVTANSMPWAVQDEGTAIKLSGVSFTVNFTGTGLCAKGSSPTFTGSLVATPDKASAISSLSLSGTLTNTGSNYPTSGSLSWTPAGVFGL